MGGRWCTQSFAKLLCFSRLNGIYIYIHVTEINILCIYIYIYMYKCITYITIIYHLNGIIIRFCKPL